jgi:hypothetical protein
MTDLPERHASSMGTDDMPARYNIICTRTGHRLKTLVNIHAPAPLLGGHSVSDPPDPISNSAVKPDSANGTNAQALEE